MNVVNLRCVVVTIEDLEVHQMDVKINFLSGNILEDIYATLEGFVVKGKENMVHVTSKILVWFEAISL